MKILYKIFLVLVLSAPMSEAQWVKVFDVPSLGSSAFFLNPNVGWIGTGNYPFGSFGQIYYTVNGGATWGRSFMPNMNLIGQVTDIYFVDSSHGWATIREAIEHGWSGLYRTFDGGQSWQLWYQTPFPIAIRQNSKGIFFTARLEGIQRSTDDGLSFQTILSNAGALGLDLDEKLGILSSESNGIYNTTADGGITWQSFALNQEAWGTFVDPATNMLFIGSERDNTFPGTQSMIASIGPNGTTVSQLFVGKGDELTGGIAGNKGCHSVIYVQKQSGKGNDGLLRSTNAGATWVPVGGPYNFNDKRFAVTGNGAVVYAFDVQGGVWKTSNGGDGLLNGSIISSGNLNITPTVKLLSSELCDSARGILRFTYSGCDTLSIIAVSFLDDQDRELRSIRTGNYFGKNGSKNDSLRIIYTPKKIGTSTKQMRLTFRSANGFIEDTIITIDVSGIKPIDEPLFVEVQNDSLHFGANSICGGDSLRIVTITNAGCSSMNLVSVSVDGSAFTLVSSFSPAILDPGISRPYLLRFKPTQAGSSSGILVIRTGTTLDTIILSGEGISGSRGYKLSSSSVTTTVCDSAEGDIIIRNISCKSLRLDSLNIPAPFTFDPFSLPLTIGIDSVISIHYHFKSSIPGTFTKTISIHSTYVNELFDTSFSITAIATEGTPGIQYFPSSITFDTTSICSWQEKEFTVVSTGCDTLELPIDTLADTSFFKITSDVAKRLLLNGDTVKIKIRFHPSGLGTFNTVFHLTTNIGSIDIPIIGYGSKDPGVLSVTPVTLGSIFTCKDTTFSFELSNMTCDSLTVDSLVVIGSAASDYALLPTSPFGFPSGMIRTFTAKFTPQVGGLRDATIYIFLHKNDGTVLEVTISLQGSGIQPVPIRLTLPNISITGKAGDTISIPISLLDASVVPVSKIEFIIHLDLDLFDVLQFDPGGTILAGGVFEPLQFGIDSAIITIDFPTPAKLDAGLIGTLFCKAYLTDTATGTIEPLIFKIFDSVQGTDCLPASIISPPQSVTSFTLEPECGTTVLSNFLKYGRDGIVLESIIPNPTRSEITITALFNEAPTDDLRIEILDDAGALIQYEVIPSSQLRTVFKHSITITGASGARSLRMISGKNETTSRFLLVR